MYQPCGERGNRPCLTSDCRYPNSHGDLHWPQYKPYCFGGCCLFLVTVNGIKQFHRVNCQCIACSNHDIYCNRYGCKRLYQQGNQRGNRQCLTDNQCYAYSHGDLQWPQYKP